MPKYHSYWILLGLLPNILPSSLFTAHKMALAHYYGLQFGVRCTLNTIHGVVEFGQFDVATNGQSWPLSNGNGSVSLSHVQSYWKEHVAQICQISHHIVASSMCTLFVVFSATCIIVLLTIF